jgi:sugar phosphate isomerase/epimerase/putative flippase GtrA
LKKLFEKYREIIVYILVGLMATVISYGVRLGLLYGGAALLSINLGSTEAATVARASVLRVVASTVGSAAAILASFYPNKVWVFRDTRKDRRSVLGQFFAFVGSRIATFFLEMGFAVVLPPLLLLCGYRTFHLFIDVDADKMSMAVSIVVITVLNYILSKLLVFRKQKKGGAGQGSEIIRSAAEVGANRKEEEQMKKLPVALQVYSVRDDAAADLEGTLIKIKEFGYDGVEFAGLYGRTPDEVAAMCKKIGLVPVSAHVPYVDMLKDPEGVFSAYAGIGCKYIAVPYLGDSHRPGNPNFKYVIEFIKVLGAAAGDHGIRLLYHNHDFEFIKIDGKYALDLLYDSVSEDLLQTEIDTCWANVGGVDPADYVRKYAGRAPVVHLKDFFGQKSEDMYELIGIESKAPKRPEGFEFRPVGHGLQNIPEIVRASVEAGAEWLVVEQDRPSQGLTPMESAKASIDYLRSIGQ